MQKKKLVLIDSMGIIHRAFHAYPNLTTAEGLLVNAVFGFGTMFLQILKNLKPDYVVFATDLSEKTFRSEKFTSYKAQRAEMDEGLRNQISIIYDLIDSTGFPIYSEAGYEADDIIGSIAHQHYKDFHVQIVTGDKDLLQLIEDGISVILPGKTFSDMREYHAKEFEERFGFPPHDYIDYKALVGDASDNIKGAKGIGEKSATDFIKTYKNIEGIYKNIDSIKERYQKILKEYEKAVRENLEIVEIEKNLKVDLDENKSDIKNFDVTGFSEFLKKYEFNSLIAHLKKLNLGKITSGKAVIAEEESVEVKFKESDDMFDTGKDFFVYQDNKFFLFDDKFNYSVTETLPKSGITFNLKEVAKLYDIKNIKHYDDLMLMGYAVNPDYGDADIHKFYKSLFKKDLLIKANLKDQTIATIILEKAYAIAEIYKKLKPELLAKQKDVYEKLDMPLIPVVAKLENLGVKVDAKYLKDLQDTFEKKIEEIKKKMFECVGHEFNPNSPKELSVILFEELSLPKAKKIKTGYSTDERTISKLIGVHPIIELILEYREFAKLQSTYVIGLQPLIADDEHIHTDLRQTTVATGRLSSINPNLQNIPTRSETGELIRKAFIADKDHELLSLDYSQIDLRTMAHLSGDENMIKAFQDGKDIHANTAATMFKVEDESKVTSEQRRIAKMINFGIIYGISDFGLSDRLGGDIDLKTAKAFIQTYFERYPKIKTYFDTVKDFVKENGYVETEFGRRRYFNLEVGNFMMKQAMYREAINMPVQGTDADIMRLAMIKIDELIEEKYKGKIQMLLQIHDELLFEIVTDEKVKSNFVKDASEIMAHLVDWDVPMTANAKSGKNWGEMK